MEIEMTGSQIKQEAPGTNTFKMAEVFFFSMGRLLESAEGQRNHASYDSAEFFSRRLRENERTLVTLTLRIDEAFPNEVEVISWQSFHTAPYFIMHTVLC